MALFIFLTVVQALVAAALVGVILMQQSEGGGLGVGGNSNSFMSARGAADFLTRATGVLAALFIVLSIVLAALAVGTTSGRQIDTSLNRAAVAPAPVRPADPLAGSAQPVSPRVAPAVGPGAQPSSIPPKSSSFGADPLAGQPHP